MTKQSLYFGGTIITMDPANPQIEAILVEDGRIKKIGTLKQLQTECSSYTNFVDLKGKTLLPAFIDAHSHLTAYASTLNIVQLEAATTFTQIAQKIKTFIQEHHVQPGEWISGFGYDQNKLVEKQHPDKKLLDQIAPNNPIIIAHQSGHMGVVNSAALKALGIDQTTADPAGGKIGRQYNSQEPNGYLEETAFTNSSSKIPQPTLAQQFESLQAAEKIYLSNGIITIQDGLVREKEWQLLKAAAAKNILQTDVVGYIDLNLTPQLLTQNRQYLNDYQQNLKIGGYKIFLDGSPQGKTAWMTQPYLGEPKDYCGYPIYTDKQVQAFFQTIAQEKVQLLVHCNGDAAAAQMIKICQEVLGEQAPSLRPVMIHAQLVRRDQLPIMRQLGMIASFFTAHTYYWGDVHLQNFGQERAFAISPAATALKDDVCFTFHQDSPVIPPNMIETLWCAVNRFSKNGLVIGPEERISPYQALEAITSKAAYQYFEEKDKGTLAIGKQANFVILDQNPLTYPKEDLRDLRVMTTIKKDEILYQHHDS